MTDDEKAQVRKDLEEQEKAFRLLRAVRELEAWVREDFRQRNFWVRWNAYTRVSNGPHAPIEVGVQDMGIPEVTQLGAFTIWEGIIALAARIRDGKEG